MPTFDARQSVSACLVGYGSTIILVLAIRALGTAAGTVVCETSPTVTVDYVYEDGSTASPSVTRATIKGQAYSITSPGIKGYTPDQEVVEGVGTGEDHTVV